MNEVERLKAELVEVRAALREAMSWNWLDEAVPPPPEVVARCEKALESGHTSKGDEC